MSTESLPSLEVGQIVYLIPTGERRVHPAQVTEEILRRTISGAETVWMIQLAGSPKSIPLDFEAAEYFVNVEKLRAALIDRTTQQVNTMVDKTVELAAEAFRRSPSTATQPVSEIMDTLPAMTATVTLPDGTKARVTI